MLHSLSPMSLEQANSKGGTWKKRDTGSVDVHVREMQGKLPKICRFRYPTPLANSSKCIFSIEDAGSYSELASLKDDDR